MKSLFLIISIFVSAYVLATVQVKAEDTRNLEGLTVTKKDAQVQADKDTAETNKSVTDKNSEQVTPIRLDPKYTDDLDSIEIDPD
jgi:hypothetical protein